MGFWKRFFRRSIGQPHAVHPDDIELTVEEDSAWFSSLTEQDIALLTQEDNVHRYAAFLKFKDEGLSGKDASRRVWKYFPYYYLDPSERGKNPLGLTGANAELPFLALLLSEWVSGMRKVARMGV